MHWKHQRLALASPTNISEDESYGIMVEAIHSKEVDCWIIIEMGKLLLSKAVGPIFLLSMCNNTKKSP